MLRRLGRLGMLQAATHRAGRVVGKPRGKPGRGAGQVTACRIDEIRLRMLQLVCGRAGRGSRHPRHLRGCALAGLGSGDGLLCHIEPLADRLCV